MLDGLRWNTVGHYGRAYALQTLTPSVAYAHVFHSGTWSAISVRGGRRKRDAADAVVVEVIQREIWLSASALRNECVQRLRGSHVLGVAPLVEIELLAF